MQNTIRGFHVNTNVEKHEDMAELVGQVKENIEELVEKAQLYNNREALFNSEQTDYSMLQDMLKHFSPYYNNWKNINKWQKLHPKWINDNWEKVNAVQAEQFVEEGVKVLNQSLRYFREKKESCYESLI